MNYFFKFFSGTDEQIIIKQMYGAFESVAVGTIEEAFKEDSRICMINMTVKWKRFKNCDLLNIAWGAHSKNFLGTKPAQEVINKRWRGQIRRHVGFHKTFFVSLFPLLLLLPGIIPFRPSLLYELNDYENDNLSSKDKQNKRTGFKAWVHKVGAFYSAPSIKFQTHAVFYILFLVLHAYVVLFEMGEMKTWDRGWILLLLLMVLLYLVDEVRQICRSDDMFR